MSENLKKSSMVSSTWVLGGFICSNFISLFSSLVLTRLLVPEIYGVMAFLHTINTAISMFIDTGMSGYAIRSERCHEKEFLGTVWSVTLVRSAVLVLAGFLLATPLSQAYDTPQLEVLLPLVTFTSFIQSFVSPRLWLYARNLQFKPITLLEVITAFSNVIFTIGFSLISPTIYAFIFGLWISSFIRVLASFFLFKGERVKFCLDKSLLGSMFKWGVWTSINSPLTFLKNSIIIIVMPMFFPFSVVGLYGLANRFANIPCLLAAKITDSVLFPLLVKAREQGKETRKVIISFKLFVILPSLAAGSFLYSISHDLIDFLYDPRYIEAASIMHVLLIFFVLRCIFELSTRVLLKASNQLVWIAGIQFIDCLVSGSLAFIAGNQGKLELLLWSIVAGAAVAAVLAVACMQAKNCRTLRVDLLLVGLFFLSTQMTRILEEFFQLEGGGGKIGLVLVSNLVIWGGAFLLSAWLFQVDIRFLGIWGRKILKRPVT